VCIYTKDITDFARVELIFKCFLRCWDLLKPFETLKIYIYNIYPRYWFIIQDKLWLKIFPRITRQIKIDNTIFHAMNHKYPSETKMCLNPAQRTNYSKRYFIYRSGISRHRYRRMVAKRLYFEFLLIDDEIKTLQITYDTRRILWNLLM